MHEIFATILDRFTWSTAILALCAILILMAEMFSVVRQFKAAWRANADASFSHRLISSCRKVQPIRHIIGFLPYVAFCAGALYFQAYSDIGTALPSKIGIPKGWEGFYWIVILFPLVDWFAWWRPFVWTPSSAGSLWMRLKMAVKDHCNKLQLVCDLLIISVAINVFCLWQTSVWYLVLFWFSLVRPKIFAAKKPATASSTSANETPHPQWMNG